MEELRQAFRIEAQELVDALGRGALALGRGGEIGLTLGELRRHAHTLKGAARIVRESEIGELAHALEDLLEGAPAMSRTAASGAILARVEAIGELVRRLGAGGSSSAGAGATATGTIATEAAVETVRVEVARMEELGTAIAEAAVQLGAARAAIGTLHDALATAAVIAEQLARAGETGPLRTRALAEQLRTKLGALGRTVPAAVESAEREVRTARDAAESLRLVAAGALIPALERAARNAATDRGIEVELRATGADVRLDAQVLAEIRDPLIHVVRNAVVHGLEPPAARAAAGKPRVGEISLDVRRLGHRVSIACRDDGRGIDEAEVRRSAIARGVIDPARAAALSAGEALALVLEPGVSTHPGVSHTAGRGIGLDVLRESVVRLHGEVEIRSEPGRFTEIEVRLPVSLLSMGMLLARVGAETVALPLDAVRCTARLPETAIVVSPEGPVAWVDGAALPFLPMSALLWAEAMERPRQTWSAIVIDVAAGRCAVGVDRIVGTTVEIVRAIPASAAADEVLAGAALDARGRPRLVLDPGAVVRAVAARRVDGAMQTPVRAERTRVLVIDDSPTTRMLEQSILETAGYDVDLAASAEEGLTKARSGRYGLFLVDVEMPGMDGYELLTTMRADPALCGVPAVLVTSRSSEADRRRGAEAGARGYLVKGEFEQGRLLETIAELVG